MDKNAMDNIRGPDSMAAPSRGNGSNAASSSRDPNTSSMSQPGQEGGQKKRRHRGGRKRRNRRQSFIAPDESVAESEVEQRPSLLDAPRVSGNGSFYRLKNGGRSSTSLESEALLDHRDQGPLRPRRQSNSTNMFKSRPTPHRASFQPSSPNKIRRPNMRETISEDEGEGNERTPLIANSHRDKPGISRHGSGYNGYGSHMHSNGRRNSKGISPTSSRRSKRSDDEDYDVNNPPSVPGSPKMGTLDDVMIAEEYTRSPRDSRDAIINIDKDDDEDRFPDSSPTTPRGDERRRTFQDLAEKDVCYPGELSEIGEDEDTEQQRSNSSRRSPRRRRHRQWPDLDILDEWSREEKEERNQEQIRAKKISEPVLVGGRLRPSKTVWHREEDDAPYRYTYFNETFDGTIHSRTISELCQFGATFHDLFKPDQPELSDTSDDEDEQSGLGIPTISEPLMQSSRGRESREGSVMSERKSVEKSGSRTPAQSQTPRAKQKRYGPRPVFWLDVLSPTETEMKVLAKAFGIHQLTTEDILMQEQREKVELFQSYYFVNYRSFEQDKDSDDYMEPINMYFVVFREAVISFHFSMTPHPANVRRRIRQLNDYMSPTSDWISYAIIDDITDVYAPLVSQIEDEVDEIDELILDLRSSDDEEDEKPKKSGKAKESDYEKQNSDNRSEKSVTAGDRAGDMLRRVGECRKKVMSLYRLLGNKADVIKGFAKRCNEHWEVAPRSEIGLYLGDIQDHIVTMTGNLSHYENLLSRAHSNYLAQINIRMNERAEQTNDVLGKLTVLGTIVLPMNIVTGLWGMNVHVPGQDGETLTWFWILTGGLFAFGFSSYAIARKLYGIV